MDLRLEGIDAHYGTSHVLRDIALRVSSGEVAALLGRNGAGKTTALRVAMGLLRPSKGRVLIDGTDVTRDAPYTRAQKGLGYVPQGRLLFDNLTVMENLVAVAGKKAEILKWVFDVFPVLKERSNQKAGTLSGGEQEMLSIGRALVTSPQILLMDEPSTGLMPSVINRLGEVIDELRERGAGVLLIEENVPLVLKVASRIYIMDTGGIVHEGGVQSLRDSDVLLRHLGVGTG
jgi:ABC-type branched-subunit amino acid transport system ATPase component